jgi:asparagine synthase (glutamine-hydrolysing)
MLGLYSCTDRNPEELAEFARLASVNREGEPMIRGPLAIAAVAGTVLGHAREGALTCVLDGALYGRAAQARTMGLEAGQDAQLVARAHRRFGTNGLTRLRGRYAAALWDDDRREGLLACDLLATRELFVSRTAGALVFATELRDLLGLLPTRPAPDEIGFTTWLGDGTCPADRTLYEGVWRLRAGELVALRRRSAARRHYWRPRPGPTMTGSRAERVEGLRAHLQGAIAKRLSPRSSAVILSGGLDSSVVSAVAAATTPPGAQLRTYSAVFPGEDYDESAKILQVNERIGIAPGALEIAPQGTLWLALHYTRTWQLPLIAAGSLIDIAATQAAASDGAEVVLDGQTGDELFGLSPYLVADRIRGGRILAALALADQWPIGRRMSARSKVWLIKELGLKGGAPHAVGRFVQARRDRSALGPPWLIPRLRRIFAQQEDRWAWKRASRGPMWWRFLSDVLIEAPHRELRLEYLRHRAATEGLVAEPPLYDVDLIEYCLRLPPELAFDRRFDRPLIREAMSDLLPEEVRVQTQKADFTRFCERAMVNADAPGTARLLTAPDALIGAYTDLEWVRAAWAQTTAGHATPEGLGTLWRLTAAEVWLQAQADPAFPDAALTQADVPLPAVRRVRLSRPGRESRPV